MGVFRSKGVQDETQTQKSGAPRDPDRDPVTSVWSGPAFATDWQAGATAGPVVRIGSGDTPPPTPAQTGDQPADDQPGVDEVEASVQEWFRRKSGSPDA